MSGVPVAPRRVFGVTLAAGDDCGDRTWVCRAHPGSEGIRVESVEPLSRLPGGALDPAGACRSLVAKVLEAPRSAWGFDFAFGDPIGGEDTLRRTDRERGLPGSRSETRIETTRLGQRAILAPLRGQPEVVVLPFDPLPREVDGMPAAMRARVASTYVLEVAPDGVMRAANGPGHDPDEPVGRIACLRAMVAAGWIRPMARSLREHVGSAPEGLRAVAAAVAAWRGYREHDHTELASDAAYGREGFAYC